MKKGFMGIGGGKDKEFAVKTDEEIAKMTDEEKKEYDEALVAAEKSEKEKVEKEKADEEAKEKEKEEKEKADAENKKKDEAQKTDIVNRKPGEMPTKKVPKGCFVRNVMHKGKIFKAGHKLDKKDADYSLLEKHLA